jgi:hypothetical protein
MRGPAERAAAKAAVMAALRERAARGAGLRGLVRPRQQRELRAAGRLRRTGAGLERLFEREGGLGALPCGGERRSLLALQRR